MIRFNPGRDTTVTPKRRHFSIAMPICRSGACGRWIVDERGRAGCSLVPQCPSRIDTHLLHGGACLADDQLFGPAFTPAIVPDWLVDRTAVITFHFNPTRFRRPAEVYRQWAPSMGPLNVTCVEMVLGDDEPEIPGSTVLRGTKANVMWQKERMLNYAIQRLPARNEFVAWSDHDILFDDPHWLTRSIELLGRSRCAVQPWSEITYLDRVGRQLRRSHSASRLAQLGRAPSTGPGGAWVARREDIDAIGGMYDRNIVGGGDAVWFHGLSGLRKDFFDRHPPASQRDQKPWIRRVRSRMSFDCVPSRVRHIWHGDREHRQYLSREGILRRHGYDPATDIETDANGLLRWTGTKPALAAEIREYFAGRREDG